MENNQAALNEGGAQPQGKNKKMSLIGGIIGIVVIMLSLLFTGLGGIIGSNGRHITPADFVNFKLGSDWYFIIHSTEIANMGETLFRTVVGLASTLVVLIFSFVMFIIGVVRLSRGVKAGDCSKGFGNACGAYFAFVCGKAATLAASVTNTAKYTLDTLVIVGIVLGALGIAAMIVLRYLDTGFGFFTDKNTLVHYILRAATFVCTVIIAALMSCPLIGKGGKWGFGSYYNVIVGTDSFYSVLGLFSIVFMMIFYILCAMRMVKCVKQLADPTAAPKKNAARTVFSGLIHTILTIALAAVAMSMSSKVLAEPVVMLIFGIAMFVLIVIDLKRTGNEQAE